MRIRFTSGWSLAPVIVIAAFVAGACSSPTVAPPVVINTPPTIESLVAASTRAEADSPIQISATVKDAETPLGQLTYTWSASPQSGTFGGTTSFVGNQLINTWRPAKGQKTPDLYTISLAVTEAYTSAGQAKHNTVSASTTVHYNDSPAEVAYLGSDFLVSKFGNFNVSPAEAVSNFSDSSQRQPDGSFCSDEKAKELDDVKANRENFHILGASFIQTTIAFNSALTNGIVDGRCQFEDIPNTGPNAGRREFVSGTCHLTTVYENFRWFLCVSNFAGDGDPTLASLKGRVPGRIVRSVQGF